MSPATDSAGQPWAGRHFSPNASSSDDGSTTPALAQALAQFAAGEAGQADVIDAIRDARLLIPLIARLGESERDENGRRIDKTQELSIVSVEGPDGRTVLPVFSCVETMSAWNPKARPVPADGARVALAAAQEETDLVVLDPTSRKEFAIRRPALWAMAKGEAWRPSFSDPDVMVEFEASIERELAVHRVELAATDPQSVLAGPELGVTLVLASGLTQSELDATLARLAERWAASDVIATRVDSLSVSIIADLGD